MCQFASFSLSLSLSIYIYIYIQTSLCWKVHFVLGLRCNAPSHIANGYSSEGSTFYYGDNVEHFCNDGFNLTGGDRLRTCSRRDFDDGPSGYWDGTSPSCACM